MVTRGPEDLHGTTGSLHDLHCPPGTLALQSMLPAIPAVTTIGTVRTVNTIIASLFVGVATMLPCWRCLLAPGRECRHSVSPLCTLRSRGWWGGRICSPRITSLFFSVRPGAPRPMRRLVTAGSVACASTVLLMLLLLMLPVLTILHVYIQVWQDHLV